MSSGASSLPARYHARPSAQCPCRVTRLMRVLIVKTSSLGDVIHTLPALTDAARAIPGITFDWMVEESFSEIPPWHPAVRKVIPMAWRRWRKKIWSADNRQEWQAFLRELRKED